MLDVSSVVEDAVVVCACIYIYICTTLLGVVWLLFSIRFAFQVVKARVELRIGFGNRVSRGETSP